MSTRWVSDQVGYDGDFIYGHLQLDQWSDRADFLRELDEQIKLVRDGAVREFDRLRALTDA